MARGDKNYDKVVRKQKNKGSDSKINAIHKMVEALIGGDSDAAAEELHKYLQLKTREIIVGESKDEDRDDDDNDSDDSDDDDDDDDDNDSDDSDDDDDKKSKKKGNKGKKGNLKEENQTQARANLEKHGNDGGVQKDKIEGNALRDKKKSSNDTKARAGLDKHPADGGVAKDKVEGNALDDKKKTSNETKAKANLEKHGNDGGVQKDKVNKFNDGRTYSKGTANV